MVNRFPRKKVRGIDPEPGRFCKTQKRGCRKTEGCSADADGMSRVVLKKKDTKMMLTRER